MALIVDQDRVALLAQYMRDESTNHPNCKKTDLAAAVSCLDVWFDSNATAINAALPNPFKSNATLAQKSRLVRYVIEKRYG